MAVTLTPRPPANGRGTAAAWFAWLHAAYRPLHAAGLTDAAAAAAIGVSDATVCSARARLGLPRNGVSPAGLARRRARSAAQGRANAGRRAFDAAGYGLPAGLYAVQVRIVLALASGPMTKAGIAAAAGLTARTVGSSGRVCWLPDLQARGLVASLRQPGRTPNLYFLTAAAVAALTAGTESPDELDA